MAEYVLADHCDACGAEITEGALTEDGEHVICDDCKKEGRQP